MLSLLTKMTLNDRDNYSCKFCSKIQQKYYKERGPV
jgi:hypothetical protein